MDFIKYADVFKALGDEKRAKIVNMLIKKEVCACDISDEFDFTQSGTSYQMKILVDSGIVNARVDGKWTKYSINKEYAKEISDFFVKISK